MRIKDMQCKPRKPPGKTKGSAVWVCTRRAVPEGKHCAKTTTEVLSQKAFLDLLLGLADDGGTETIEYGLCEKLPTPKAKRPRRQK